MTSCCGDASNRQMSSAIKPSRHPAVPFRAPGLAAVCPAQLLRPIGQWFWKMASSQSTKLFLKRSSPVSKRPKRTSVRTDDQSGTVFLRILPNDCIFLHHGTCTCLCLWNFLTAGKLWGCFVLEICRGCRCSKHTWSLCVLDMLQSSYLLSCWCTYAFVSQHCTFLFCPYQTIWSSYIIWSKKAFQSLPTNIQKVKKNCIVKYL